MQILTLLRIATQRSVTSMVCEYNEIAFAWRIVKHLGTSLYTSEAEIKVFFTQVIEDNDIQKIFKITRKDY